MGKGMDVLIDQMRSLYDEWDIRVMVLLSLVLQVLLQLLGNRRKFSSSMWVRIIVWCSYISSDSIVVMALGIMSSNLGRINDLGNLELKTRLHAFWAPCLLILLGGPDTITAYSVEDNQLWLRHFVVLVVQTSVTGYICFLAWTSDYLSYLSLLMMVAAVIKYGERVWVLWQVNFDNLRSIRYVSLEVDMEQLEYSELTRGYALFQNFKIVFLSQKLGLEDEELSTVLFKKMTSKNAFKTIEIELGFMYDLLHTKAVAMYTRWGLCRRLITSAISCVVLAVFSYYYWLHVEEKKMTGIIDVAVTFVLLATIISLEIYYWVFIIFSSDWADVLWFTKRRSPSSCSKFWYKNNNAVTNSLIQICKQPRWSNSAGQLSFFSLFMDGRPLHGTLGPYYHAQHREISDDIKDQIFNMIKDEAFPRRELFTNFTSLLTSELQRCGLSEVVPKIRWGNYFELDDSILLWHIATELCCNYDDTEDMMNEQEENAREAAKLLSEYMFYLLVRYPLLLQSPDSKLELKRVSIEIEDVVKAEKRGNVELLRKEKWSGGAANYLTKSIVKKLLMKGIINQKIHTGRNIFKRACNLTKELMNGEYKSNAWRLILRAWLAHLYYAAYNCREDYHVQQLRRGGELLTHVWMFMVHLGFTNHFNEQRISLANWSTE